MLIVKVKLEKQVRSARVVPDLAKDGLENRLKVFRTRVGDNLSMGKQDKAVRGSGDSQVCVGSLAGSVDLASHDRDAETVR